MERKKWTLMKKQEQALAHGMQSNTTISLKVYLMAILDNSMFRHLQAIFRLSLRELKVLLYTLCAHVVQRYLHASS